MSEGILQRIGELFRVARARSKQSQRAVAEGSGIHRVTISEIERGEGNPSFKTVCALVDFYGLTWHEVAEAIEGRDPSSRASDLQLMVDLALERLREDKDSEGSRGGGSKGVPRG